MNSESNHYNSLKYYLLTEYRMLKKCEKRGEFESHEFISGEINAFERILDFLEDIENKNFE